MSEIKNLNSAIELERLAHGFREEGDIQKAFRYFDQAANIYLNEKEFKMASFCFASAATCWNLHTGWQDLRNASSRTKYAADAAYLAGDEEYARQLYTEAAVLYEKEGDGEAYSQCFFLAQVNARKCYWNDIFYPLEKNAMPFVRKSSTIFKQFKALKHWLFSHINNLVWGYGEKPIRALVWMGGIIIFSGVIYFYSHNIVMTESPGKINFFDSIYFSVITFSTVGYGDYMPVGWVRWVAMLESLSGISLMPLFLIGLTRRYLRMSR